MRRVADLFSQLDDAIELTRREDLTFTVSTTDADAVFYIFPKAAGLDSHNAAYLHLLPPHEVLTGCLVQLGGCGAF